MWKPGSLPPPPHGNQSGSADAGRNDNNKRNKKRKSTGDLVFSNGHDDDYDGNDTREYDDRGSRQEQGRVKTINPPRSKSLSPPSSRSNNKISGGGSSSSDRKRLSGATMKMRFMMKGSTGNTPGKDGGSGSRKSISNDSDRGRSNDEVKNHTTSSGRKNKSPNRMSSGRPDENFYGSLSPSNNRRTSMMDDDDDYHDKDGDMSDDYDDDGHESNNECLISSSSLSPYMIATSVDMYGVSRNDRRGNNNNSNDDNSSKIVIGRRSFQGFNPAVEKNYGIN